MITLNGFQYLKARG